MKLRNILLSIAAISFVTLFPHTGAIPIPFAFCLPILLFVWLYLKYHGEDFSSLGFSMNSISLKSLFVGSIFAVAIFTFLQLAFFPFLEIFVVFDEVDVMMYDQIRGSTSFYIFILIMGWIVGGFYEEIVFHGFIFTRLEKMVPGKYSMALSFLITGIIFGLYHLQLGTADAINAFMAGVGYHAVILYHKRNLWYGIFCHAAFDTIAITMIYMGYL